MSERYTQVIPLGEDGEVYISYGHLNLGGLYEAMTILIHEYDYTPEALDAMNMPVYTYLIETYCGDDEEYRYQQAHPNTDDAEPFTVIAARGAWRLP